MLTKLLSRLFIACVVCLPAAISASAQGSCASLAFRIAPAFDSGTNVSKSAIADFNGDGKVDVAVANYDRRTISVLNGDGVGGFAPGRSYPTIANVYSIAAADLNNDTKIDIVAGSRQSSELAIFINTGSDFQPAVIFTAPGSGAFEDLQSGDFNGDGNADIASIRDSTNRQLHIFLGNGQGSLTSATSMNLVGNEAVMKVGNLNGDNLTDIIASGGNSFSPRHISFMYGAASGSFSLTLAFNPLEKPMGFSIAKLNNDPNPDFVVAFEDTTTPTQPYIRPYLATLGGSFTPGTSIEPPYFLSPIDVTTADYNDDGIQDIAATFGGLLMVTYGRGDGIFQDATHWAIQTNVRSIYSRDLNGDSKLDLIAVQHFSGTSNSVAVLTNLGNRKFNAPQAVLWGLSQISAGDFNNDNLLDFVSSRKSDFVSVSSVEINLNSADGLGPDMGVPTARGLSQMTVGDFNGDNNRDVVTSHSSNDRVLSVYLGNGTGSLAAPVNTSLNQSFENVITGRFNNDANDDAFVVDGNGRGYSMLSNGNGAFTTAPNFPVQLQGSLVKLVKGDFNEDGHLDLIVSNGVVNLWLGDGTGQFTRSTDPIPNLGDVVVGDFNEDGNLDLAGFDAGGLKAVLGLGNGQFGQTFSTPLQSSGTARSLVAGDFDGDGSTDVAYLGQLADSKNLVFIPSSGTAQAWGAPVFYSVGGLSGYTAALHVADFNADGKPDLGYNAETSRGIIYNEGGTGPCISINDVTVTEGDTGTANASFTVTLSQTSAARTAVNYTVAAGTATLASDFQEVSGRLEIVAGQTTATINVPIVGDVTDEFDEQFTVNLSSPANGAITRGTGTGTILDNDAEPTLTVSDVTANEGSFSTFFNFTVTLSASSQKPISIRYTTADGTAIAGSDYNATTNVLNIQPGAASASFGVLVTGDNVFEPTENFFVNLTEPVNVSLADAQGTGTITNDDPIPTLSVIGTFGNEGDSGIRTYNVTIQLSNPSSLPVTVNLLTSDGTAIGNVDYVAADTPLTLPPLTQTFMAPVQFRGDVINEPNETFFVNVYNVVNATIAQPQSQVTIVDDDSGVLDFEGDGKTDIGIFRPGAGEWWYQRSLDSLVRVFRFGTGTDKIVPADYTGDGRTDIAVWRPSSGEWFVLRSENNTYYSVPFGLTGDVPTPADYDNDGRADVAIFRPSAATWYIAQSTAGIRIEQFGLTEDQPVPGDYDGDGKADIGIFRPSVGQWWISRSTAGVAVLTFGNSTDKLVQGDYTGDGKSDIALWRPSTGEWFILRSENFSYYSVPFGTLSDIPAPGDYDGDGKYDTTVFRPSSGTWYSQRTTAGILIHQFGAAGDQPVANAFVP